MKTTLKYIAVSLLFCMPAFSQAQEVTSDPATWTPKSETSLPYYRFADNWFASIHLGVSSPLGENVRPREFFKLKSQSPAVALSVGKYFVPAFGARMMFGFYRQTGWANKESRMAYPAVYGDGLHHFNTVNGFLDGILNLNNTFGKYKESRRFNASLFLGIGFNTTFGYDQEKLKSWAATPLEVAPYNVQADNKTYFAVRTGFILSYKLNKYLDLEFEGQIAATDDNYDGIRYNDKYDGYTAALLGLKYHFLDYVNKRRFAYTTLTEPNVNDIKEKMRVAQEELEAAKRLRNTEYDQTNFLEMTVNFIIDRYNITDIQRANVEATANYLKAHPEFDVVICGYADVQTAYPAYNVRLSKRRVTAVFNMLVYQFGIDPNRLSIDYQGDRRQPYMKKNEWNRVVVFQLKRRAGA